MENYMKNFVEIKEEETFEVEGGYVVSVLGDSPFDCGTMARMSAGGTGRTLGNNCMSLY